MQECSPGPRPAADGHPRSGVLTATGVLLRRARMPCHPWGKTISHSRSIPAPKLAPASRPPPLHPTMPRSRPPVGEGLHLTRRTDINRSPGKLRHRGGSSTPARARASTYDRERLSSTTESMPAACRSAARTRPAGPAPMIATWVLVGGLGVGRSVPGGRAPDGPDVVVDAGPGGLELWQDLAAEVVHGCPAGVDRGVERSDDRP